MPTLARGVFAAFILVVVAGLTQAVNGGADVVLPAANPLVRWVGRTQSSPDGDVSFDWEGVAATVAVRNLSFLAVNITDNCRGTGVGGGSRWLVTVKTTNPLTAAADHRVATFFTGSRIPVYYLFNVPGSRCDPNCDLGSAIFTLTRLTESRLSGCSADATLSINSFITDGEFIIPPAPALRRIEFIGDSITAGDLNDNAGATQCANGVFNDDITQSWGSVICRSEVAGGFGADCMHTAWGGITLGVDTVWGMNKLYPHTFSAGGPDAYGDWDFGSFPADAVVVNLGTNDYPIAPAVKWQETYVSFVTDLVHVRYRNPSLAVFLAYGPMTTEYEPFVRSVTATLVANGVRAVVLDLTLPHPMTGCYGHPSAADNVEIAAKARPQIASVMAWT